MDTFAVPSRRHAVSMSVMSGSTSRGIAKRKSYTKGERMIFAISRGWKCDICKRGDLYNSLGWDIDHVIELADGGPDTEDNKQLLCGTCHANKSRTNVILRAGRKRSSMCTSVREDGDEVSSRRHAGERKLLLQQLQQENIRHTDTTNQLLECLRRLDSSDGALPVVEPESDGAQPNKRTTEHAGGAQPETEEPLRKCSGCKKKLAFDNFSSAVLKRKSGKCITCAREDAKRYRERQPLSLMLQHIRQREKRAGRDAKGLDFDTIKAVLELYEGKCIVTKRAPRSGESLTLLRVKPVGEFNLHNSAPVLTTFAKLWDFLPVALHTRVKAQAPPEN